MLNREAIINADDLSMVKVSVPEWGGDVFLKTMTGSERDAFEASLNTVDKKGNRVQRLENIRARFLVRVIVDENKERLFGDADAEILGKKSAAVLDRLFAKAQTLNGISDGDVEELAKNLEPGQSEDSTSA